MKDIEKSPEGYKRYIMDLYMSNNYAVFTPKAPSRRRRHRDCNNDVYGDFLFKKNGKLSVVKTLYIPDGEEKVGRRHVLQIYGEMILSEFHGAMIIYDGELGEGVDAIAQKMGVELKNLPLIDEENEPIEMIICPDFDFLWNRYIKSLSLYVGFNNIYTGDRIILCELNNYGMTLSSKEQSVTFGRNVFKWVYSKVLNERVVPRKKIVSKFGSFNAGLILSVFDCVPCYTIDENGISIELVDGVVE